MPTYAYRCQKCDAEIEIVQSMSDPPLKRCKVCRGALRRVYHPVGIVLKGSGFYKTDNRPSAKSGSGKPSDGSGSSESPASKDSSSSESTKSSDSGSKDKSKGTDKKASGSSGS